MRAAARAIKVADRQVDTRDQFYFWQPGRAETAKNVSASECSQLVFCQQREHETLLALPSNASKTDCVVANNAIMNNNIILGR
jgi:hypothetical protein